MLVNAKNAFNQSHIVHPGSSMLVDVDSEAFLADNSAKRGYLGTEYQFPVLFHCFRMFPRTLTVQMSGIFQKVHSLFFWFSDPEIYSAQDPFINKWKAFWILSEIDVLNSL